MAADGLLVLSSLLFGITFFMAVYFWLAVPHTSATVWKHNRLKKIIHVFQVIHNALPWHYHINSSNPVYRLQLVQILSSSSMMLVGIFMHKYPQDCIVTAVLFGIAFGVNQFAGYCFLLIKAMTVDAKWRVSNLKECMRSLTSLLILLAFIIPRSIPGELNKEGECVLGTNRKRTIGLVLSGSLLDILLKIGYARLFTEPLKEVAIVQERQFGKDGKKRAEKAFSLIRTNNIISALSCVVMCIAYIIMGVGLVQENALSGYFGAYLTSFAHMIPSMISTKSAWKRKGAVGKQDTSAAEGTQPNSPTGRKGSSNKQRLRRTTSNQVKRAGTGNESMDDVTSKSEDDLHPRGSTVEEKTSVTEIELPPKPSNPEVPNPELTPAVVVEEKKLEEVKEEAEFKKPPSNPKQKTDSAGKPGTGTNRSNPRTGGSAGNGVANKAVGRGGYGGVGASYAAGSYEIDVDLKFDSEAAEFLLDIQSLGAAIPEAEVAQHEDIAAPVSRGLFAGKDTYMDPIFSPKVAGGFGRGVAAKTGQGHARQRHSVIYRDTEVSSTKSIPNANNANKDEAAVSPVPNAPDHDISKPQTETEHRIDNV